MDTLFDPAAYQRLLGRLDGLRRDRRQHRSARGGRSDRRPVFAAFAEQRDTCILLTKNSLGHPVSDVLKQPQGSGG